MYRFNQNAFEIRSGNEQLSTSIVWGTVPPRGFGAVTIHGRIVHDHAGGTDTTEEARDKRDVWSIACRASWSTARLGVSMSAACQRTP